jgi:hypothetical protein
MMKLEKTVFMRGAQIQYQTVAMRADDSTDDTKETCSLIINKYFCNEVSKSICSVSYILNFRPYTSVLLQGCPKSPH